MKKNILFVAIFLILSSLVFAALSYANNNKIEDYLKQATINHQHNYKVLYDKYKDLSKIVFKTKIDINKIKDIFEQRDRDKLFSELKDTYRLLKQYNIKQLHFHLPSNKSFLRFHRPEKYGDNLTNIRETVAYVNKTKKYIDGFEIGRIYNGFRFVYPIFNNNKYIGSVEVSFSSLVMSLEFLKNYNTVAHFKIQKKIIDKKVFNDELKNYAISPFEKFYIEKKNIEYFNTISPNKTMIPLSKQTRDIVNNRALDDISFSLFDTKVKKVLTFIKIQNPISRKTIAMFVIKNDGSYIVDKEKSFYVIYTILIILLTIILFYICKEIKYRDIIKQNNDLLEQRVKEEVSKNRRKDEQLMHQSRLAQMGEMISMIAHQWRQPLGSISSAILGLKLQLQTRKVDFSDINQVEKYIKTTDKKYDDISEYTQFLSKTIDDFRNFYKEDNIKENIKPTFLIQKALDMIEHSYKGKNIKVSKNFRCDDTALVYQNEIMQVILNILKNAEDNFMEKGIKNSEIKIETILDNKNYIITVKDNGGGIPSDILPNIFDPYFSTKKAKNGTGIGLYMSKIIIEDHHKGILEVKNIKDGVCFSIILPLQNKKDIDV